MHNVCPTFFNGQFCKDCIVKDYCGQDGFCPSEIVLEPGGDPDLQLIREFAKKNGFTVLELLGPEVGSRKLELR